MKRINGITALCALLMGLFVVSFFIDIAESYASSRFNQTGSAYPSPGGMYDVVTEPYFTYLPLTFKDFPPYPSKSYYIVHIEDVGQLGCDAGTDAGVALGTQNQFIYLNFGKPITLIVNGYEVLGIRLYDGEDVTVDEIKLASVEFANVSFVQSQHKALKTSKMCIF